MELETPGPRPPHPRSLGASGSQRVPILGSIPRFKITLPCCRNAEINFMSHLCVSILVQKFPPHFFLIVDFLA